MTSEAMSEWIAIMRRTTNHKTHLLLRPVLSLGAELGLNEVIVLYLRQLVFHDPGPLHLALPS